MFLEFALDPRGQFHHDVPESWNVTCLLTLLKADPFLGPMRASHVSALNIDVSGISDLSDELLIKILSFLPTKYSSSLRYYSQRYYSQRSSIPEFIDDKNLPLHRAPVIECLSLELSVEHIQPEDIKRWVQTAVSRCVRELEISYYSEEPSCICTCSSLVILKLSDMIIMDVPSMACLPSLKTLGLDYLTYEDDESLQGFLDICPVLEDLSVQLRGERSMGEISIIVPTLQRLLLAVSWSCYLDGYVIDTPSLKYFKLEDWDSSTRDVEIKYMPELREAYVDVVFFVLESVIGSITSVIVKHLTICSEIHGVVEDTDMDTLGDHKKEILRLYILENACCLKKVTIFADIVQYSVPHLKMIKELAFSSRASSACELEFVECPYDMFE
ncbi:hypothetical protein Bca4012_083499 [Brassica carinata]